MRSLLPRIVVVLALWPTATPAQAPPAPVPVTRVDSAMHRFAVDGSRLHAARFVYRTSLTRDSVVSFAGEMQVQISEAQYAGSAGWLLTETRSDGAGGPSDSLVVARADLRPLHWTAVLGPARLAVEFTPDTIFGVMSSPLGRRNIVLHNRGDLLVNTAAVDAVLGALPLGADWRDSASVMVVDAGGSVTAPAMLAVDGEEHLTVPAGEYDCWIVSLETERGSVRLWVGKEGQGVVRSEQILPHLGGAVLERILLRVEETSPASAAGRLPY